MLLKKHKNIYSVVLGQMHEQAVDRVIYKPEWYYAHLPMLNHRLQQSHLVCELQPWYQGFVDKHKLTISGHNACARIVDLRTSQRVGEEEIAIVADMVAMGPNQSLFESMMEYDPTATSWEFRLRCLVGDAREGGGKTLIPTVTKVITWDLFLK